MYIVTNPRSASKEFELDAVVPIVNTPPTIDNDSFPTTATVHIPFQFQIEASDLNGDPLSYDFAGSIPNGMTISKQGLIQWTPLATGTASFTVRVSDGQGGVATQPVTLTVGSTVTVINPTIIPIDPGTAVVGLPYQYQVVTGDSSNTPELYSFSSAPLNMSIDPVSGLITWTATDVAIGTQHVSIRVTNGTGGSTSGSFDLPVVDNVPDAAPTISSNPPGPAVVGRQYRYQVVASDPNGDVLTYRLDQAPVGLSINASSGLLSWTPDETQTGIQHVVLTVTDGRGGSFSQPFDLPVVLTAVNTPPVIDNAPVDKTIVTGHPYQFQILAHDPDGDPITYHLDSGFAGMSINASTGLFTWTPSSLGHFTTTVSATDGRGGVVRQTFAVTAVDPSTVTDHAPVIHLTPTGPAAVNHASAYQWHTTIWPVRFFNGLLTARSEFTTVRSSQSPVETIVTIDSARQ